MLILEVIRGPNDALSMAAPFDIIGKTRGGYFHFFEAIDRRVNEAEPFVYLIKALSD